jgi:hypothetical protein
VKRKSHINFIISIGALTLGFLTSAHSQRLGPSHEQCRKEAAEWGGQTGEPIDITSLPLNELDRRRNELLSCIPGDYDNIDRYRRLERAYATPKCNRLSFFFNRSTKRTKREFAAGSYRTQNTLSSRYEQTVPAGRHCSASMFSLRQIPIAKPAEALNLMRNAVDSPLRIDPNVYRLWTLNFVNRLPRKQVVRSPHWNRCRS